MIFLKSNFIIILLFSTVLFSCSEEPEILSKEDMIKGEWNMIEYNGVRVIHKEYTDGTIETTTLTGTYSDIRVTVSYNEDNIYVTRGLLNLSIEVTQEGTTPSTHELIDEEFNTQGTYEIDGNNLVLIVYDSELDETKAQRMLLII